MVEPRREQAAEESRKGAAGMLVRTPAFPGSRRYNKTLSCHSRYAEMYSLNHWIPAFAGMTKETAVRYLSGMAKGSPE